MLKFNGMPIYWLAHSISKLDEALIHSATVGSIAGPAINVKNNIDQFNNWIQGFPLSKAAALEIVRVLDHVISSERLQQPNNPIPENEQTAINVNIYNFQAVFYSEFSQANIFYVTQKGAYDITVLIDQGQNVLSKDSINMLSASKDEVINDLREATKCLTFDIPTAVGFHIYRAIEALVRDYFPVIGVQPNEWNRSKSLGHYIKLLQLNGVDHEVTVMLQHFKDNYRNPSAHPDEFWDLNKAESAFMFAVSLINVMIQDIAKITKAKTSP